MSARSDIMARIRAANSHAGVPEPAPVPREYHRSGEHLPGSAALVDLFVDRLVDYKATVLRCDEDGLPAAIAEALAGVGPVLVPAGLPAGWCPAGTPDDGAFTPAELDWFAAVVTGCAAACAVTGTIALDGSPDQGRRAITLVPDVHVCVVGAGQVVQTVPELIGALDPARPVTFVSGPSATSDIELQRVEGVHGPRTLIVIIVE